MIMDLTERRQSEERLRKSEARLAEAEAQAHLGHWEWELGTDRIIWSDEKYRITGLQPQEREITYDFFLTCVHPEDRMRVHETIQGALREKQPANYSFRVALRDGTTRVHETHATVMTDNDDRAIRMFGIVQDITERRQTAEALELANEQLRILSQRLFQIQEEERRHLARELHDQIGQALTAAKINLQGALQLKDRAALTHRVDDGIAIIDQLTQKVRELSLELRPPLLDDLGLVPALRSYLDHQAQIGGFHLEFFADAALDRLATDTETACFRVVQEAVTNILRHAKADRVDVELRRTPGALHLLVRDNGIGFDADRQRRNFLAGSGLGMLGMRERVTLLGGEIDCKSTCGHGVELHAFFPIQSGGKADR
jgi:two-component system sensor histidine kinase UhpB